jgi:hypothetical protein
LIEPSLDVLLFINANRATGPKKLKTKKLKKKNLQNIWEISIGSSQPPYQEEICIQFTGIE